MGNNPSDARGPDDEGFISDGGQEPVKGPNGRPPPSSHLRASGHLGVAAGPEGRGAAATSGRDEFQARIHAAKACRELEDYQGAAANAERAAQIRPHPDVMHFIGEAQLRLGDMQKAALWFSRALELEPGHVPSHRDLGQLMYRQSQWQEAEAHLVRVWESDQRSVSAVQSLALVKYKLKKFNSCRQCCEAVLRLDPQNMDALWLLAEINKQEDALAADRPFQGLRIPQTDEPLRTPKPKRRFGLEERRGDSLGGAGGPVVPASCGILGQGDRADEQVGCSPEDLERLLWRAERASAVTAGRPGGPPQGGAELQWKEVLLSAKAALRSRPDDALALRCVARALLCTGGPAAEIREYARRAAEKSDEASGSTLGYDLHAYLAAASERERDAAGAERHYAAALSSKPGDESALLGLARVCLQRRDTAKAKQLYEQVSASNPACVESWARLADIATEASDYHEAYRLAMKASSLAPGDCAVLVCLGQACAKLGRTEEATRALEKALAQQPGDVAATSALAELHKKAGREQDAASLYKRQLEMKPGDYDCNLNLARLHAAKGAAGASQAVHYFRTALQCRPNAQGAHEVLAQMAAVQIGIGAWKDAQQALEGALREAPESAELWRQLMSVYEHQQDPKGQVQCLRRLAQLKNLTTADRIVYGELLLADGHLREAREQLEQALQLEPNNLAAMVKLATCWRQDPSKEGNLDEARRGFERVLQQSPANLEALEGAAYCHRKMKNFDQAIQLYQQCLKVKSNAESPLYYLGDILYRQHRHAECQHYLSRLVETDCSAEYKTGALYLLAKSHVSLDEYEEAERHARAGLTLKPNHPHFLFILALVKNRLADYDMSIDTLRQALQHCDQAEGDQLRVEIHDWLAQAYERKHEYAKAMAELDQALQKDPSHVSSLITRGLVHIQQKQLDQAETAFRRALAVEKNHALALVRLGYCKLLVNDHHEAQQLFQRALQQRCGTVALPRSVKGCARLYMALSLMGQQDVDSALVQLAEARKSHRNFSSVCAAGKPSIVRGECEGLVQQLRAISDLDINLAQAWQLVHLMAKELESHLREPGGAAAGGATSRPENATPGRALPSTRSSASASLAAALEPARGHAGAPAPSPPPSSRAALGAAPASPRLPGRSPPPPEARRWTAAAEPAPAAVVPAASATAAASAPPERRQWTPSAAPAAETVHPSASSTALARPAGGPQTLRLEQHEQIDFSELTQYECLGTGGFGAVYRGLCRGQEVAIKRLFCEDGGKISPLQLEELEKEVAALRSLHHPRLVSFIGACLQPPNLVIVTEFMPGGSLHHLLHKAKTPLTLAQQAKLALQICEGVAFLHSLTPPVVHRDLKSLNIVLDHIYNAKICDFGLTQSMDKTHISLKEGGNGGSPRYMAPECYDCKGKITDKVDVWAMGCILVEAFGGPLPYDDCNNIQQIVAKVLIDKQMPYIPHHLPRGVRPIVEDCFNFDVKQRIAAQDVYSRLRQLRLVPE